MATTNETTGRKKPGPKPGSKAAAAKKAAAKPAAPAPGEANPPTSGAPAAGTPTPPAQPQGERSPFLYKNRDYLTVTESGQKGQVRARMEYASGAVSYLLAYVSNGELKDGWFDQEMLSPFVERRARQ